MRARILSQLDHLRRNKPTLFWGSMAACGMSALGMATAFALAPNEASLILQRPTIETPVALDMPQREASDLGTFVREGTVRSGDTLVSLLSRLGCDDDSVRNFVRSSGAAGWNSLLSPGRWVRVSLDANNTLLGITMPTREDGIQLSANLIGNQYVSQRTQAHRITRSAMKSGVINSSLFAAADAINLPDAVTVQMAEIFSGQIDFQRDLRKGDRFAVVYEQTLQDGKATATGRIVAAEFINGGKRHTAYSFANESGKPSYYDENGNSLKRAFLKSPLEFSRVTSGFSMRFHPILQTWRAHKGVDFGAPIGTKVRSTGDGVIDFAGAQNGYGNVIVVKHAGNYSTYYAHLNGFAAGIRKGRRVSQGDTIGYVGKTGWATGPHLHYEFRVAGVQRNPLSTDLPTTVPLTRGELAQFKNRTYEVQSELALAKTIQYGNE